MINMINYTAVLKNVKSQKIFFAKKMKIMYDPQIFLNWFCRRVSAILHRFVEFYI